MALYVNQRININDSVFHFVNEEENTSLTCLECVRIKWFLSDEIKKMETKCVRIK